MAKLKLYINADGNSLISGLDSQQIIEPGSLPFFYGDTLQLQVYLFTKLSNQSPGVFPYSIIPTTGLQLFMYVDDGIVGGTIYTQQITWTPDATNSFFTANLSLLTANLTTLMGATAGGKSAYLQIGYVQNSLPTTAFSQQISIKVGFPSSSVPTVPAGQTALSAEVANASFFPINPVNGQPLYLATDTGEVIGLRAVKNADGGVQLQPFSVN